MPVVVFTHVMYSIELLVLLLHSICHLDFLRLPFYGE